MSTNEGVKRRLYMMGAGALGFIAFISVVGAGPINPLRIIVGTIIWVYPAILLMRRAARLSVNDGIDPFELALMMIAGGTAMLAIVVPTTAVLIGEIAVGGFALLLFGVPTVVMWLINSKKRTKTINPA